MSYADMHNIPLPKTRLKFIAKKRYFEQICTTVGQLDKRLMVFTIYFN